jgi:hypothetical protein
MRESVFCARFPKKFSDGESLLEMCLRHAIANGKLLLRMRFSERGAYLLTA